MDERKIPAFKVFPQFCKTVGNLSQVSLAAINCTFVDPAIYEHDCLDKNQGNGSTRASRPLAILSAETSVDCDARNVQHRRSSSET